MNRYKITSCNNVFLDDYDEGELEQVNCFDIQGILEANSPIEAIEKFFESKLYYSFNIKNAIIECDTLYYSVLVDEQNYEATETQKEEWKKGKFKLYSNNISIRVDELKSVEL